MRPDGGYFISKNITLGAAQPGRAAEDVRGVYAAADKAVSKRLCLPHDAVCEQLHVPFCCMCTGKKPVRYNTAQLPSYARLVNFTERLWDYESCAEAQLKIWLARHLIASENSGEAHSRLCN